MIRVGFLLRFITGGITHQRSHLNYAQLGTEGVAVLRSVVQHSNTKNTHVYLQYLNSSRHSISCSRSFPKFLESLHRHSRPLNKTNYASCRRAARPASSHALLHTLFKPPIVKSAWFPAPAVIKERTRTHSNPRLPRKLRLTSMDSDKRYHQFHVCFRQSTTPTHGEH